MSTELGEGLQRLADEMPSTSGRPAVAASELWRQGRRRQRRRALAGAFGVLLVAALAGLGGAGLWSRTASPPLPADAPTGQVRLPDRLYNPGAWLPGTADHPIGPLVAVISAKRESWRGGTNGLVGVSARTGEYRFLDLPDDAGAGAALSADGRWLAYWIDHDPMTFGASADGIGVYDTVSGDVVQHAVVAESPFTPAAMVWAGGTLWCQYETQLEDAQGMWRPGPVRVLTWYAAAGGAPSLLHGMELLHLVGTGTAPSGVTTLDPATGGRRWVVLREGGPTTRFEIGPAPGGPRRTAVNGPWHLSPDGRAVAGLADPDNTPGADLEATRPILAGAFDVPGPGTGPGGPVLSLGTAKLGLVPGAVAHVVLAWRDPSHVVALTREPDGGARLDSVDITTGDAEPLTYVPRTESGVGTLVATDLLAATTTAAAEPDWPIDRRILAGSIAVAVLIAALVLRFPARRLAWTWRRGPA